jgi:glycosyltransferase involved in cell wall biosynthesis
MSKKPEPTILLIRNAAKDDFGGAETYTVSIAEILKKNGFHPVIVSRSQKLLTYAKEHGVDTHKGWWWKEQNWSGYRVLFTPIYLLWQSVLIVWYLALVTRTHAHVLHIQSKDDFIAGTIAGKLLGKRIVWTDHMDLRYIFQNISRPLRNPIGKLVFRSAYFSDHLIVISENEHRLVTAQFKHQNDLDNKLVLIKNGVIDRYVNYPQKNKDIFSYCVASRMVINKGVGEAIDAYITLKKNYSTNRKIRLDIYGDGQDLGRFRAQAREHSDIVFHGHQENALQKIAKAEVFMLPSYQEGFSIALLEAAMLGKAIIASDVDSNSELVHNGETGLLVPARDVESLASAMSKLLSDTKLKRLIEANARKSFENNFNLETIVLTKIIPLYLA